MYQHADSRIFLVFFTKNNSFFNGNTTQQKPLTTLQVHVTHIFKPGIWASVSYGLSRLGETVVNDIDKNAEIIIVSNTYDEHLRSYILALNN